MDRRRHRTARPGLALVPHAALRIVEFAFVLFLVARHIGSPGLARGGGDHTVRPRVVESWAASGTEAGGEGMQRRRLGGLEVSAIGLGCATMTPFYGAPDPQ